MLSKIMVRNYRCFRSLDLDLNPSMNVFVGDNDSGKSTLFEAVSLALTCRIRGRFLLQELTPYMFNADAAKEYVDGIAAGDTVAPPEFVIDLFFEPADEIASLFGTNNLAMENAPGVRVRAFLSPDFAEEYRAFISDPKTVRLVPAEYYDVEWLSFSGNPISRRGVPATASLIDASAIRLQSGADHYLQEIITSHLDRNERVELSRTYRTLREEFATNPSVKSVNEKLTEAKGTISDRELSLSIDISQRFTWESSLVPHLDELPFQFIGKGEQNSLKILLAVNKNVAQSHIVLVEEPENHLSHSSLSVLVRRIADQCDDKQVLLSTHSSYVLNKLGIESLVLINRDTVTRLTDLPADTVDYFKKLSGYDTLRLVLAKEAILVEGPSDELIVQRAYRDVHGCLPIEAGIDVINVRGLSHQRFLDIAVRLGRPCRVVTDNDGKDPIEVEGKFAAYTGNGISVHVGHDKALPTLEPQLLASNSLELFNKLFGKDFATDPEMVKYMVDNKTTCALALFETEAPIAMPQYIADAVA